MADSTSIWSVREINRVREVDSAIDEALSVNAPQALLRDLHRPITTFSVNPLEFEKNERPRDAAQSITKETKETLFTSYRIDLHALATAWEIYKGSIVERRQALGGEWADAPKFGNQYLPITMTW